MSAPGDATALNFVRRSLAERRRSQQSSDAVTAVEAPPNRTQSKSRPASGQPPRVPSPQTQRTTKVNADLAGDAARREQQQLEDDEVRAYWAWLAATSAATSASASSPLLLQQAQQQQHSDAPRRISYYAGFLPDALDRAELPSALRTTTRTSVDLSNTTASPLHGGERACESVWGAATSSSVTRGSAGNASRRRRTSLSANFADTASGRSHSGTRTQSVTFDETLAEAMVSTSQRMKGHQQQQQQRRRSSGVSVHSGGGDSDEGERRRGSTFPSGPGSRSMSVVADGDASHGEGGRALTWASGSLPPLSEVATTLPPPPSLPEATRRTTPQSPVSAPRDRTGSNSYCGNSGDLRAPPLLGTSVREVKSVGDRPRSGNGSGDAQLSHHQLTEAFYGSYQGGKMARDAYLYFISQQQQQGPPPSNAASTAVRRQRGSKGSISKNISSSASAPSTRRPTQRRSELRPHLLSQCIPAEPPAATAAAAAVATSTHAFASPPLSPAALAERRLSPTPTPTPTVTATGQRGNREATRPASSLTPGEKLPSGGGQKPRTPPQPRPLSALCPRAGCVNETSLPAPAKQCPPQQPPQEDTTVVEAATAAVAVVPAPAAPVDGPKRRLEELWRRSERIFQQRQQGPQKDT